MTVSPNYLFANLKDEQLQKIQALEQNLRQETKENIVLIAYDEKKKS